MKTISVLLTKYPDLFSCFLYHVAGHGYTHISLGLDEKDGNYYSFNYKGFCVETFEKHRKRGINKSICYQIQVPDLVYDDIQKSIYVFRQHPEDYQYNHIGAIFAMLHIPLQWKKHYICSHFVAELLINSGAVSLRKNPSVYLPNQFRVELETLPQLAQVICNPL